MLIKIRNAYGVVSIVVTGLIVFAISRFTSVAVQAGFAYFFTWFLLFAGVKPIFELQSKRRRYRSPDSDADQLARLTRRARPGVGVPVRDRRVRRAGAVGELADPVRHAGQGLLRRLAPVARRAAG